MALTTYITFSRTYTSSSLRNPEIFLDELPEKDKTSYTSLSPLFIGDNEAMQTWEFAMKQFPLIWRRSSTKYDMNQRLSPSLFTPS